MTSAPAISHIPRARSQRAGGASSIVPRKPDDFRFADVRVERRLHLLLIEWVDRDRSVVERVCAADVNEGAGVRERREWVLATLT